MSADATDAIEAWEGINDPVDRLAAMREAPSGEWWAPYPAPLPITPEAAVAAIEEAIYDLAEVGLIPSGLAAASDIPDDAAEVIARTLAEMAESAVAGTGTDEAGPVTPGSDPPVARAFALIGIALCAGSRGAGTVLPSGGGLDTGRAAVLGAIVLARVLTEWEAGLEPLPRTVQGPAAVAAAEALGASKVSHRPSADLLRWALGAFDLGVMARVAAAVG